MSGSLKISVQTKSSYSSLRRNKLISFMGHLNQHSPGELPKRERQAKEEEDLRSRDGWRALYPSSLHQRIPCPRPQAYPSQYESRASPTALVSDLCNLQ